jgi:hypothetical protein
LRNSERKAVMMPVSAGCITDGSLSILRRAGK